MKNSEFHKDQEVEIQDFIEVVETVQNSLIELNLPIHGEDDDNRYDSIECMWRSLNIIPSNNRRKGSAYISENLNGSNLQQSTFVNTKRWYSHASEHYESQPSSMDGMLGGFAILSDHDLQTSRFFLTETLKRKHIPGLQFEHGCDCGAGIGRTTKGLFCELGFRRCDLVECSQKFIDAAKKYLQEDGSSQSTHISFIHESLQNFVPERKVYDVIWIQWVIGYLTDYDCVQFFKHCKEGLRGNSGEGVIVLKDNVCPPDGNCFQLDLEDSSVTRSKAYLHSLADQAGLCVLCEEEQKGFPSALFPVWIISLIPKEI